MTSVPQITLNDGRAIPQLGFGVFQIPADETADAVRAALETGYRHIDTAQGYRNERGVGEAVRTSGLARGDIFVTSKLSNPWHRPDDTRRAFEMTLRELRLDYVDMFLIHWPLAASYGGDFPSTWNVLEEFRAQGRARSIGVSNFQPDHLARLKQETATVPAVNQIEAHPYFPNDSVRRYGESRGIVTQAWSPLAQGAILTDESLVNIASTYGRGVAQIVLRWHVERGSVVFPKASTPRRIRENFQIFDFELDPVDVATIDVLSRGEAGRTGPHPDDVTVDSW